jgi:MerR family transcriptional regulator, light-induced transcriptional regulator
MSLGTAAKYVSTSRAATALGVSVSTVKRWVDEGVLPAQKTAGGHRKLLVADVLEMARRGHLPHADLSLLVGRHQTPGNTSALAEDLYQALARGDAGRVRLLVHGSYRNGMSIESLADLAIASVMERIGLDWAAGRIDVMEEHRATQLCAAALFELKAVLEDSAVKNRPRAVGGGAEGDFSLLPSLLAQMVLLDAGWDAIDLGPNTPIASFEKALVEIRPRLMWLSVSHLPAEEEFVKQYRTFYRHAEKAGVAVAIGGRGLVESVRARILYTTHGDGLRHLAAFARALHAKPAQPQRGRPRKAPA